MSVVAIPLQRGRSGRTASLCAVGFLCVALSLTQHRASLPRVAQTAAVSYQQQDANFAMQSADRAAAAGQEESAYRLESVTVERNFVSAVQRVGVSAAVAAMLVSAFAHEIDFRRDLKPGNAVKFVFDDPDSEGADTADTKAGHALLPLAVRIEIGPRTHDAFLFRDDDGNASYRTKYGLAPRPDMSRLPVSYRRISSHFSPRRLHPVTLQWRAHDGVDLAAPVGTPVYAPADGNVTFVGRQTGFGNVAKLGHSRGYSTTYAHLQRFAAGLRTGGRVRHGDVIGYVGSTGWSTGPHLHYEVRVNGVPHDPLTVEWPRAEPIRTADAEIFDKETAKLAALF